MFLNSIKKKTNKNMDIIKSILNDPIIYSGAHNHASKRTNILYDKITPLFQVY